MEKKHLELIDKLIVEGTSLKIDDAQRHVNRFSRLLATTLNIKIDEADLSKQLFTKEQSTNNQTFIAYCFLRLFSGNRLLLEGDREFKIKLFTFFDRTLKVLYEVLKIQEKDPTYTKEDKLFEYINKKEKELSELVSFHGDLRLIDKFQHAFNRHIKARDSRLLIAGFLEIDSYQQKFDRLFSSIKLYLTSDDSQKYSHYSVTISILNQIINDFADADIKYSHLLVVKPFSDIKSTIEDDFLKHPSSKPSILEVTATEKKFPFNSVGIKNKIELRINNTSLGNAFDVTVKISDSSDIEIKESYQFVGVVDTSNINIEFDYVVTNPTSLVLIDGQISWNNFDGQENSKEFYLELPGQTAQLKWEELQNLSPYDLEPVDKENELIGRDNILTQLRSRIRNKVGSSYIYGQRRVGKTSVVKTLQSIEKTTPDLIIIYIEAGDWTDANGPLQSMNNLGKRICQKIKRSNSKFSSLQVPEFSGSFNKIAEFLDDVADIDEETGILIILDEFDRISNELFRRTDIGQSFMLTLRSISNRPQFGFILVGGEKLEFILSQWQEFNKFKPVRLDYFDKQQDWEDFKKLIKDPVTLYLEFNDQAIDYIYTQTSGNPYFTKLICIELFRYMVNNRDNHVTLKEAIKATEIARNSSNIAATDFSHFWEDGIKEKIEKEEEVSINRRKLLISISELIRNYRKADRDNIINEAVKKGLSEDTATKVLEEFEQRKILKHENEEYRFFVKFFEDWLINQGIEKIITTFEEEERVLYRQKREEELRVKPEEINHLIEPWKTYKGQEITSEKVVQWLHQFDSVYNQRLIFKLLQKIRFYNEIQVREKMENIFSEVQKIFKRSGIDRVIEENRLKRSDILVSYLDPSPGKSGAEYTKKFVEVNNIYFENAVEPDKISSKLNDNKNIKLLVFVDDFIGTGKSVLSNAGTILEAHRDAIAQKNIPILIGIISGFQSASTVAEEKLNKMGFQVSIKVVDPLNNNDKSFDENSKILPDLREREETKTICLDKGVRLEKAHPLGYGNCQALVVFPNTCPNNSLPILWKKTKEWVPLFER